MGRKRIFSMNILIITFIFFEFGNASQFSSKKINNDDQKSFKNINFKKNRHSKRKISLDDERPKNESFVPVNIYFDLLGFNTTVSEKGLGDYKGFFYDAMNKAKNILKENLLINIDLNGEVEFDETDYAEDWEIQYFNNEIFRKIYCRDFNYYIIFVFDDDISKIISSKILDVLGDAPLVGKIIINPTLIKPYLLKRDCLNYLTTYMLHQFIHLLGFHIDISGAFVFSGIIKEEDLEGSKNYFVDSENIINYAKKYFDCSTITRIYLELDEGDGNIHWPSRILLGDIMTSFDYPEEQILSGFTLAFLEDLSYIHVVYNYTGGLMRFGKNKGCYFINKGCTEEFTDKEVIFGNEFYLSTNLANPSTYEPSCSSGRLSKTFHIYTLSGTQIMGPEKTDFCPISEYNRPYLDDSSFISIGLCSNENYFDEELQESFTSNSFCVLSSLVPKGGSLTSTIRAVCHEMYCTSGSLTIKIGEYFIVCPRSGGKVEVENFNGYLLCPDYNLICTGSRLCNNIYDCLKEQSVEINETFYYNYTIKTTQNSEVYASEKAIYGYELTQDGNCSYLCGQCGNNKICYKCAPHYKPDENDKTKCIEKDQKCQSFKDDDTDECKMCKTGYFLAKEDDNNFVCQENGIMKQYYITHDSEDPTFTYYKKCHNGVQNCFLCDSNTKCLQCVNDNYKVIDDGIKCGDLSSKLFCLDTKTQQYKSCSYFMENCYKCQLNNRNFECLECNAGYSVLHDNTNNIACSQQSFFEGNNHYFTNDSGINYYSCGNSLYHDASNCLECFNKNTCSHCKTGYKLVNQNTRCYLESDIENNIVYYNPITQIYSPCSDLISLCKKCNSTENCTECGVEGVLEESNICITKVLVENNSYFEDETTHKYVSCSIIDNCLACTSRTVCSICKEGFDIKNNICQIHSSDDESDNKLSTGEIIGIVFGCVGFLLIVGGGVYFFLIKYKNFNPNVIEEKPGNIEENVGKVEENINLDKKNEEDPKTSKRNIHNV